MDESDSDLVRTLATQLNLGGLYAEELCQRAGVEKTTPIVDATDADYEAIHGAIRDLADTVAAGAFEPRVYYEDDRRVDATPLPLSEYEARGFDAEAFGTFNEALDDYFTHLGAEDGTDEPDRPDFEAEIAKHERIIEQQEEAIERFDDQAEREREKAERLYARYDVVDELLSTVRAAREDGHGWEEIEARLTEGADRGLVAAEIVTGVDGSDGTVTVDLDGYSIRLDPSTGVEQNADRLYTEAKRIEEKRAGAEAAIEDTREELEAIKRRREEWESGDGDEADAVDGEAGDDEPVDWLSRPSVPIRKDEQWYDRFRWFRTGDGFLVVGGRNAEQNEELVKKYLERGDRFLHTQAHGGPATVLKATEPSEPIRDVEIPDRSLREAAQFAVSYSTVWKEGKYSGDVYMVGHDQVTKTPESGEYLSKGGFAIRGDRTYFEDTPVGVAVGIACEPATRVIGGPPTPIEAQAETTVEVEPGRFAQGDVAKRIYRVFRERFADTSFVRKVASPDEIQKFLPPGTSAMVED